MNAEITPQQLLQQYQKGTNISAFLREHLDTSQNNESIIEMSYDLQAGSYIEAIKNPEFAVKKQAYDRELADILRLLGDYQTLLEVGVGEATTLSGVLKSLDKSEIKAYGFDLSWSRIAFAKQWIEAEGQSNVTLCTGSLSNIPFLDNSIDIVYTSHSIEPNEGNESPILQELYRVARDYIVLFEPGYELADEEAKQRMRSHGYCRDLAGTATRLGYTVEKHEMIATSLNPLNPTAVTIIKKDTNMRTSYDMPLACPQYKTSIVQTHNVMYSHESLMIYPIICGIPCLRVENGIVATKFSDLK